MSLRGGEAERKSSQLIVFGRASRVGVHPAQSELCFGVALFRGAAIEFQSASMIARDSFCVFVFDAQLDLRFRIALVCRGDQRGYFSLPGAGGEQRRRKDCSKRKQHVSTRMRVKINAL